MADTTTSQNIDLSSWDTLYITLKDLCEMLQHMNNMEVYLRARQSFIKSGQFLSWLKNPFLKVGCFLN
jgi:hypothetical protein